jgi:cation:H+ antiporter
MLDMLMIAGGLVLLVAGANWMVQGAVTLAERAGVSALLIGLTIVAWGTSAPELVVSAKAGLDGKGGIAIGNVIGSNIFNVLGVMGLCAIARTLAVRPGAVLRDSLIAIVAGLALIAIVIVSPRLEIWHGVALVAGLLAYTLYAFLEERRGESTIARAHAEIGAAAVTVAQRRSIPISLGLVAIGLALLVGGGTLLVDGAVAIARQLGMSEAVIGLTIVAIGTSLPEVATSIVAALKRQVDVAVGNVLGSNTFNLLGILGTTGLLGPVAIPPDIGLLDIGLAAAVPLLILAPALLFGRIGRFVGLAMVLGYAGYVWLLIERSGALSVSG